MTATVINLDCRLGMMSMPEGSVDAIVCDPPYGLSRQPNMREVLTHWLNGDEYSPTCGGFMGKQWEGWGTALKPCHEPIVLCRKPLDGTYAHNVQKHGVGGLNIEGCKGPRWPGNVMHDGCLPEPMDRYFYSAKATKADREVGLENFEHVSAGEITGGRKEGSAGLKNGRAGAGRTGGGKNIPPTVKPTELMRWLCRLITPPGGMILDPFTGSGSTGRGAVLEGFQFMGFELSADYAEIARARILDAEKTAGNTSNN